MHALQNIEPYEIVNASWDAEANFQRRRLFNSLDRCLTTENQVSDLLEKVPVKPVPGLSSQ